MLHYSIKEQKNGEKKIQNQNKYIKEVVYEKIYN